MPLWVAFRVGVWATITMVSPLSHQTQCRGLVLGVGGYATERLDRMRIRTRSFPSDVPADCSLTVTEKYEAI